MTVATMPRPAAAAGFAEARLADLGPQAIAPPRPGRASTGTVTGTIVISDGATVVLHVDLASAGVAPVNEGNARLGTPPRAPGAAHDLPVAGDVGARGWAADIAAIFAEDTLTQADEANAIDPVG